MPSPERNGVLREAGRGARLLLRGFAAWGTSPQLMLLGAVPALIVGVIVLGAVIAIAVSIDPIAVWLTPFAEEYAPFWRDATRLAASLALLLAVILLGAATFTALTLAVGDPFYERIWLAVEGREGGFRRVDEQGFWASTRRGVVSGLRLLIPSAAVGLLLFAAGLIPAVGGLLAVALGAVLGGRLLARELLARPLDARGLDRRTQAELRRRHRAQVTGFGALGYLLFLIPLGAVIAMPAAVAGSVLLAREILGPDEAVEGPAAGG